MNVKKILYAVAALQFSLLIIFPLQAAGAQVQSAIVEQQHSAPALDQLSPEEKKWFAKFQEGTFYAQGWQEITADILEKTPAELIEKQRAALDALGIKIGCEWSKDNDIRKIDNAMLKQWGALLQDTAGQHPDQIVDVLGEIDEKVERLLD